MHDLDPVFQSFSRSSKIASVLKRLGYARPLPVQSMYIFKVCTYHVFCVNYRVPVVAIEDHRMGVCKYALVHVQDYPCVFFRLHMCAGGNLQQPGIGSLQSLKLVDENCRTYIYGFCIISCGLSIGFCA